MVGVVFVKYRKMGLDIEVLPPESGRMPTYDKDPIIIFSLSFDPAYEDHTTLVLAVKPQLKGGMLLKDGVMFYPTEADLLSGWLDIVRDYDPDFMVTYNGNEFDFPYIDNRLSYTGVFNDMSRNHGSCMIRNQREDRTIVYIPGRIVIDLLPLVKKHVNPTEFKGMKPLKHYSLDAVSKALLDIQKGDVKPSEMRGIWLSKDYMKLIDYARRDAELNLALLAKMNILERYIALSLASGVLLQDVINSGQTVLIDSLIMREFKKYGRVIPPRGSFDDSSGPDEDVLYEGAKVLEPLTGLHEHIVIMDYASLYPSIMRAYNLSPDTLIDAKTTLFTQDVKGIVPDILERLYNDRVAIKKEMKATKDKDLKNLLNAKQYAVKTLLNSIYGYFGYSKSRLFEVAIASTVTRRGREALLKTKEVVEKHGLVIIGGDTDSVFIGLRGDNCSFDSGKELANLISQDMAKILPKPMSLAFEAYGLRGLFLAKKRYAVYITEDGKEYTIKMRGIETRRRDWTEYTEETLNHVFDILLKDGDIKGAGVYALAQLRRIKDLINVNDDKDLLNKLVLTKKYSKPIEDYKVKTAHIGALNRHISRGGQDISLGDRIAYYVTAGKGPMTSLTETIDYVIENNVPINKQYYIKKQLLPPLDRIFEVLKFNLQLGKFNAKQMTLGECM